MPPTRVVRRLPHALVFVKNPPSVEIFRQDQFLDEDGAFVVGARRRAKQKSWKTPLDCVILEIGQRSKLKKINVKPDGSIHVSKTNDASEEPDDPGEPGQPDETEVCFLGSRYSEQLKQKQQAAQARQENLDAMAQFLTNADGSPVLTLPALRYPRRVLVHSEEVIADLKHQLSNLACWKMEPGDVEISPGTKVYYNGSLLCILTDAHKDSPSRMLGAIVKAVIPQHIRANRALTYSGGNGESVAVPTAIAAAARGLVQSFFKLKTPMDTARIIGSVLSYSQHPPSKQPTEGQKTVASTVSASSTGGRTPIFSSASSSSTASSSSAFPFNAMAATGPQGPTAAPVLPAESNIFTYIRSANETLHGSLGQDSAAWNV